MKRKKRFESDRLRRGIYILPNIFTSINLFCGFYAVIACIDDKFVTGAFAIIVAGLFDWLDGKIARATNTTSKFGVEYDSLADLVSFGIAPALMMYLWALKPLGRIGWVAAFIFMACGCLRLARFNTQVGRISSEHFVGLPIPAGAGMNAVTVLIFSKLGIEGSAYPVVILVLLYILSFLMVSTIKYNSFKKPELFRRTNWNALVGAVLILGFIAAQPSIALFLCGVVYISSGPIMYVRQYRKIKQKKADSRKADEHWASPV